MVDTPKSALDTERLLSLDFLRGFIMVLLMMSSTGVYDYLYEHTEEEPINLFVRQFVHHPWNGLRFWDLVQPAFMFMAGTAMTLSLHKQWSKGVTWNQSFRKILKRCGWLFFWGVLDYAVRRNGLSFELWDVLTQLSFTTLVAFLIFRWSTAAQIAVCIGLLLLTEILYRYINIPGFDQPFTDQHNFGNYMDLVLMNKINGDGWVAINCIPTAVHTIAGALAGKLLLSDKKKIQPLFAWGLVCVIIGYGLDLAGITPIIKRIATSSFVLASLGWCLWFLALSYWWIDVKVHRKYLKFFTIVGMNSIFIYVFFEIVGSRWFNGYISAISNGITGWFIHSEMIQFIIAAVCIFTLEWLLCYFLYKRKIFFKV
ncbi:MAG: acyltransferase family protein [Chitinophagales bacterium]